MRPSKKKPRNSCQSGNEKIYNTAIPPSTGQISNTLSTILSHMPPGSIQITTYNRSVQPDGSQNEEVKFATMTTPNTSFSVGNISGDNVNINTTNSFNTNINIKFDKIDPSLFDEAKRLIEKEVTKDQAQIQQLHADIDAMKHCVEHQDKKRFLEGYCTFMEHLSNHVTVLAPIVTLLNSTFF